jgi:benzoyl-CoA reductase/2-hydroxyglutaryl-CoA dehydratase subunit BcrC/BadD/HgdB
MFGPLKHVLTPKVTDSLLREPLAYELLGDYGKFYYSRHNKKSQGMWLDFTAKKLKAAWQHRGLVAWSNAFFPFEMLYGLDVIPCHPETLAALAAKAGLSQEAISCAESCGYSPDICSFYRCAIGLYEDRLLPRPDIIISTPYLCDGSVKFFHNMSQSFGCEHYLIDVPYHDSEKARKYLAGQLEEIAGMIAKKQGRPLDLDRLVRALELSNEAREYAQKTNELRRAVPCPLPGGDALSYILDMQFFGFGSEAGVRFFQTLYQETQAGMEDGRGAVDEEKYRLLWLHHIKPYYPNKIVSHLEEMGASVCFGEANHIYWEPMDLSHPFESMAAKLLANPSAGPIERRARLALEMAEKYAVDGVIHFSHWGCRQSCGGEYIIRDHLARKGIPMLILHGDGTDSRNYSEEQTRLRLDAFLEMLEAKSDYGRR